MPPPTEAEERDRDTTPNVAAGQSSNRHLIVIGGIAVVVVLLLVLLIRKPRHDEQAGKHGAEPQPSATERAASPAPTTAPSNVVVVPPGAANTSIVPPAVDLAAMIASAAPGSTIKVPAGFYTGGLVATKAIRIVGTAGQVLIQSDGRECLSVRAPGVAVQGVQFICNGIGELPAISVADGADLELEGCRIQSATGVGVAVSANATLKAVGTTFSAMSGVALRVQQAKATLTQSTFPDAKLGLSASSGAVVELQSCAFERNGSSDLQGATIFATGQGTNVTATDCRFANNNAGIMVIEGAAFNAVKSAFKENTRSTSSNTPNGLIAVQKTARAKISGSTFERNGQGIVVTDRAAAEIEQCEFAGNGGQSRQLVLPTVPIVVAGQGASATVRNTVIADSMQFAAYVLNGGSVILEDIEISGARTAGLAVGDRSGPPARAEIRRGRFYRNGSAMGVFAGSSAMIEDSDFRENERGVMVGDRDSTVEVRKTKFISNKDQGLVAYEDAKAIARECEFRNNARGAQSGMPRKSGRGSITLEDCLSAGNRTFGVGAHGQSELILARMNFEGGDKTNVFRERGAVVQTDGAQPSPGAQSSASPPAGEDKPQASPAAQRRAKSTPRPRQRRGEDEAAEFLRRLFNGR